MSSAQASNIVAGRMFKINVAPLPAGGAVAVLQDITEIEKVERTRRDFIANVSHELRTPLTSIRGYVETLLDSDPVSTQSRQFLEVIQANAARMTRLTEDLLTLARVESGELKLRLRPVSASALLHEASENFKEIVRTAGIVLEIGDSSEQPVLVDNDAIQQVLGNLIENAIKYAPSGSRILIGAASKNGEMEFYVRDFGPGISSEHQPRLFERFYRVDPSRSRESGGTGLGLAIVKHIVLNHRGGVRVDSNLNHGSTFYFTLPTAVQSNATLA
jgi:two-component system phosphate regulon sensor histidine kinase PhoR